MDRVADAIFSSARSTPMIADAGIACVAPSRCRASS
jgi:hypothetical protein